MTLADKWKQFTADPRAQKAGTLYKKAETGVWKVLDPVGRGANRLAGRAGAEAFWPTELAEGELDKAARILRTFTLDGVQADDDPAADSTGGVTGGVQATQAEKDKYASRKTQKVIRKIPPKALQGACGIAIMTCFRTGFGFSGAGGSGVVMARLPDGSWSPPSGILVHTIGWGLLIGLDIYDVVLILRKPAALKAFEHPKLSIGGELSVAAGPVGNGAVLDSGVEASPCWSYTKSKGAYAGLQLDGTIVLKRDDANARFYGQQASTSDIFKGRVIAPKSVRPLWQTLYAAEGRSEFMGTEQIPQGLAPGEIGISAEEAKELEAMGKAEEQDSGQPSATATGAAASSSNRPSGTKHFVPPPLAKPEPVVASSAHGSQFAPPSGVPPSDPAIQQTAATADVFGDANAVPGAIPTSKPQLGQDANAGQAIISPSKDEAGGAPPGYSQHP